MGATVTGMLLSSSFCLLGMPETSAVHTHQRRHQAGNEVRDSSIPSHKASARGVSPPPTLPRPNQTHTGVLIPDARGTEMAGDNADKVAAVEQTSEWSGGADMVRRPSEEISRLDAGAGMEKMMHLFRHGTPAGLEQELARLGEGVLRSMRTSDVSSSSRAIRPCLLKCEAAPPLQPL